MRGLPTLAVLTGVCALAALGAYLLFHVLKSRAAVRNKHVQLGGVGAAFVVLLFLLLKAFPTIIVAVEPTAGLAQTVKGIRDGRTATLDSVSLSPATQLLSDRDFADLDKNQYVVLS